MATMVKVECLNCKVPFLARLADRKRGWGKFCSKSCKAERQEKKHGYYRRFTSDRCGLGRGECFPSMAEGEVQ